MIIHSDSTINSGLQGLLSALGKPKSNPVEQVSFHSEIVKEYLCEGLQSRTLNSGHTALIPVFLSSSCFIMIFSVELSQVRGQHWKGHGKEGWRPHVNVIRLIDPSSNVTDCSLNVVIKLKLFIFIFHHVLKWCHFFYFVRIKQNVLYWIRFWFS